VEGEVFLTTEADDNGDECDGHLRGCGIPVPDVDAQLKAEVVDGQVNTYDAAIAQQLTGTMEGGLGEGDVFIKPEAGQQCDGEDDAQCGDMRGEAQRTHIDQVMPDQEVIAQEIQDPVQHHVSSATDGIAKHFPGDESAEGRIEKIDYFCN